jgi:hypothetical protein
MDANSIAIITAGGGALVAGVTIGTKKVLEMFKSTGNNERGAPCPLHPELVNRVDQLAVELGVVSTDVRWIRDRIDNEERQQREEQRWAEVLEEIRALKRSER